MILKLYCTAILTKRLISCRLLFHEGGSVSNWKKRKEKYPKGPESRKSQDAKQGGTNFTRLGRYFQTVLCSWLESEIIMLIRLVCIWFAV